MIFGIRYANEWGNGLQQGQGKMTLANGKQYVGQYRKGKRNGHHTYTWANGDIDIGAVCHDDFCGPGTFTASRGGFCSTGTLEYELIESDGRHCAVLYPAECLSAPRP